LLAKNASDVSVFLLLSEVILLLMMFYICSKHASLTAKSDNKEEKSLLGWKKMITKSHVALSFSNVENGKYQVALLD
jgi:hypothetical protein